MKIDKKGIKKISKSIADDVSNRIYAEFLFMRYIPEVIAIENRNIIPIKTEDFKQQLKSRINSI